MSLHRVFKLGGYVSACWWYKHGQQADDAWLIVQVFFYTECPNEKGLTEKVKMGPNRHWVVQNCLMGPKWTKMTKKSHDCWRCDPAPLLICQQTHQEKQRWENETSVKSVSFLPQQGKAQSILNVKTLSWWYKDWDKSSMLTGWNSKWLGFIFPNLMASAGLKRV